MSQDPRGRPPGEVDASLVVKFFQILDKWATEAQSPPAETPNNSLLISGDSTLDLGITSLLKGGHAS